MKNNCSIILILIAMSMLGCGSTENENGDSGGKDDNVITELNLTDPLATNETKSLYANLWSIQNGGFMFGHHDYPIYGVGWKDGDSGAVGDSDVKRLVGAHPAVFSCDMMRIFDGSMSIEKLQQYIKSAHNRGNVIIMCWHQDNPLTKTPTSQYPIGTSWDNTKVVDKILTEGSDMNIKYKGWLDQVADFFLTLKDEQGRQIPVIWRPLHEHTQTWSWWGASATTQLEFINFWRFMVKYLRDTKGVHNLIWAISPQMDENYGTATKTRLQFRWPGDEYVDFLGMDCYHGYNSSVFTYNLQNLSILSQSLKMPCGVTETGIENNHPADYWVQSIYNPSRGCKISMVVAWRNESANHAFGPYPSDASADNFKVFEKLQKTLFEKDLPDMYKMPENVIVK